MYQRVGKQPLPAEILVVQEMDVVEQEQLWLKKMEGKNVGLKYCNNFKHRLALVQVVSEVTATFQMPAINTELVAAILAAMELLVGLQA